MINDLTELVFILDKSGSMHGLEADTIGGFNSLIEKQKKEDGKALVTTILFDDKSEMIHDRVDLQYIRSMTNEQYVTGGTTALLDGKPHQKDTQVHSPGGRSGKDAVHHHHGRNGERKPPLHLRQGEEAHRASESKVRLGVHFPRCEY